MEGQLIGLVKNNVHFSVLACLFLMALCPSSGQGSSRERSFSHRSLQTQRLFDLKSRDFFFEFITELHKAKNGQIQSTEQGLLEWVPNGSLISTVPPHCTPEGFHALVKGADHSSLAYAKKVQTYFNDCESELYKEATGGLLGLIDFALVSYPFLDRPNIKPFQFESLDGRLLKGYIAVRDHRPRPWVIFKCGVFCSAADDAASIRNYLIHLFDQAPFNVVVIENRTGTGYIRSNKVFNFGGYFEAKDFIDVAQWLKTKSPFRALVSSLHLVAVSLAGNGAYLAEGSLSHIKHNETPLIQSISALCAVSDLKPTVDNMYDDSVKGFLFSKLTWYNLESVRAFLPLVEDLLMGDGPEMGDYPALLGRLVSRYIQSSGTTDSSIEGSNAKGEGEVSSEIKIQNRFWEQTYFSKREKPVDIPLFIMASTDDSVVDYEINTGKLWRKNEKDPQERVGVVSLAHGDHCGFATAHGYSAVSSVLREFITANAPEFREKTTTKTIPIKIRAGALEDNEKIVSYWWALNPEDETKINLQIKVFSPSQDLFCEESLPYDSESTCYRQVSVDFPASFWRMKELNWAKTNVDREVLVRELNGMSFVSRKGQQIVGQRKWPDQIDLLYQFRL